MIKVKEYDVEDKEVFYVQEFYRDEYKQLHQGIMYEANADSREIEFTRARVPQALNVLYKKQYLNKDHEFVRTEWLA